MKKLSILASGLALAMASTVPAQAEVTANIAVTSDYVWRGVSQTGYASAVQGGIDYAADGGFFAGTWLSNTSFGSNEMDLYLGFGGEAGDLGYSLTFNYYMYPSIEADADFGEVLLDFSFSAISFGVSYTVVSELDDELSFDGADINGSRFFVEGDLHYYIGVGGDVGEGWSLSAMYGIYDFDTDGFADVDTSYGYFEVGAAKDLGDFGEFALTMSIADEEAQEVAASDDADELISRISWSKGF